MNMILNRQDARSPRKAIFSDKKLGVLGALAVNFFLLGALILGFSVPGFSRGCLLTAQKRV
jgi:hypothetical protein